MRYHTTSQISEHIAETPEGYLLCRDVPIARTGVLEYAPDEVPIEARGDGPVRVARLPEDVFASEAIGSFEGKPISINHPDEFVTPETWRELAVGHAQNVRRGEGEASDLLLADLLITDQEAIDLVRGGLREISCGYDADYEQEEPGRGWQRNISGNHIALVRQGRCGPRCKINDNREDTMSTKKLSFVDKLLAALRTPKVRRMLDEAGEEKPEPEPKPKDGEKPPAGGNPTPATDDGEERLAALEARVEEMAILLRQLTQAEQPQGGDTDEPTGDEGDPDNPTGDEDDPKGGSTKTSDSARAKARTRDTRTVDADTRARALILHPGIRVADTDKRCAVQRAALRTGTKDAAVESVVKAVLRGNTLDACDCVTLDAAFVAASEVAKVRNNTRTVDGLAKATVRDFGKSVTPKDINKANREFHKKGA